jgi:hypothetical protein
MNRRHILVLGVLVLTLGLALAGQASARPLTRSPIINATPDLVDRWIQRQTPATPDLVERYVQRQPAASFYSPAALKAQGLRMQAMARTHERMSTTLGTTSNGFDVRDALLGAAGGVGVAICLAGLLFVVTRSRRAQVAL